MMKHRLPPFLILLILLCAAPTFSAAEPLSCSDNSIVASAVRTAEDIQVFVQCAYEFVQEVGFEEARRAFHEEERWRSGPTYLFVVEVTPMSNTARAFVFPPDASREGAPWGLLIDVFGNDWFKEQYRLVNNFGEGWIYYSFTNPATGRDEPKASYIKSIDWNGVPAAIGAGIYRRDLPGTCNSTEVNAALLEATPSDEKLQEFVRCAAMELESAADRRTGCPLRRHGAGIERVLRHHHTVDRSALEERLDLLVRRRYVRQRAVQRRSLQPGVWHTCSRVERLCGGTLRRPGCGECRRRVR